MTTPVDPSYTVGFPDLEIRLITMACLPCLLFSIRFLSFSVINLCSDITHGLCATNRWPVRRLNNTIKHKEDAIHATGMVGLGRGPEDNRGLDIPMLVGAHVAQHNKSVGWSGQVRYAKSIYPIGDIGSDVATTT